MDLKNSFESFIWYWYALGNYILIYYQTQFRHLTIGTNSCEVPAIEQFENPVHTATRSDNPASGVGMHQSTKTQSSLRAWVGKPQGEPDVCQKAHVLGLRQKFSMWEPNLQKPQRQREHKFIPPGCQNPPKVGSNFWQTHLDTISTQSGANQWLMMV